MRLKKIYKKKVEEDSGWVIIEKDGRERKAKPNELPEISIDTRGGVSPENGIPTEPTLDSEVRRRGKKNTSI